MMAELRRNAEATVRARKGKLLPKVTGRQPTADTQRALHELEVHQIELEMQNVELRSARDEFEALLGKYTDLYDYAPVGYFSLDEKSQIHEANLSGAAILGVERIRLANCRFSRFVAPASRPDFLAFLKLVFAGTGQEVCDLAMIKEDATDFWARFRATAAISAPGTPKWCRMSVSDITAIKHADDSLRESELHMRLATEATSVGIWEWNIRTNVLRWDAQLFRIYGIAPTPGGFVQYSDWSRALLPEDLPENERILQDTVRRRGHSRREFRIHRRDDGEVRDIDSVETVRTNEHGRAEWVVGTNLDITDRKRAEEKVRESQKRFHTLADAMSQLAWMAQPDGFITWYNQRWYDYTGTTPEQMVGWGWQSVHDPEVLPKVLKGWKASIATGKPFEIIFPLRRADGGFRQFLTRAVPQKDEHGRVLQWFGTNTDIDDQQRAAETQRRVEVLAASNRKLELEIVRRKAVEKALQESVQQQARLLDQAREMEEQLRVLSHGILHAQEEERKRISRELHDVIAQALTVINVQLAALKGEATIQAKGLQHKINGTQRLVEKSMEIVHRFARELRPSVLDDLGLIPALRAFVKTFAKETKLPVILRVFAGVEQLNAEKRIVIYRAAQEALTNVARHARATQVELCIEKIADVVRMKIHDDGRGFSVQRTFQAKKIGRLGLLGMRERVEMVGGRLTIESAAGHGTTIEVQIPFSKTLRP